MRQWYYPAKRYASSELVFAVVFYTVVRLNAGRTDERTFQPGIEYPLVGVRKSLRAEDTHYDLMLNDGTTILQIPQDDVIIHHAELGNSWGGVHDIGYHANTLNAKVKAAAIEEGKAVYLFGTAEVQQGRPVFIPLFALPVKPQRNEPWYLPADKTAAKREAERERMDTLERESTASTYHNRRYL